MIALASPSVIFPYLNMLHWQMIRDYSTFMERQCLRCRSPWFITVRQNCCCILQNSTGKRRGDQGIPYLRALRSRWQCKGEDDVWLPNIDTWTPAYRGKTSQRRSRLRQAPPALDLYDFRHVRLWLLVSCKKCYGCCFCPPSPNAVYCKWMKLDLC